MQIWTLTTYYDWAVNTAAFSDEEQAQNALASVLIHDIILDWTDDDHDATEAIRTGAFTVAQLEDIIAEHEMCREGFIYLFKRHVLPKKADPALDLDPATECQCANCGTTYRADELHSIDDIEQRIAPGETFPAGQCPDPDCGALCDVV